MTMTETESSQRLSRPPAPPCPARFGPDGVDPRFVFHCQHDAGHPPPHVQSGVAKNGVSYKVEWMDG